MQLDDPLIIPACYEDKTVLPSLTFIVGVNNYSCSDSDSVVWQGCGCGCLVSVVCQGLCQSNADNCLQISIFNAALLAALLSCIQSIEEDAESCCSTTKESRQLLLPCRVLSSFTVFLFSSVSLHLSFHHPLWRHPLRRRSLWHWCSTSNTPDIQW